MTRTRRGGPRARRRGATALRESRVDGTPASAVPGSPRRRPACRWWPEDGARQIVRRDAARAPRRAASKTARTRRVAATAVPP